MSGPPVEPDELTEEAVKDQFVRAMGYVIEWADTDARREDVMSTLWTGAEPAPDIRGDHRPATKAH